MEQDSSPIEYTLTMTYTKEDGTFADVGVPISSKVFIIALIISKLGDCDEIDL